jgi:type IV pilus assembly protein PilA
VLKMIRARLEDDRGFTLIELMVVVLIIAILLAIAIPTFLGLRERAQDRAAQSDLRNGLTAAKAFYTDDESYTNFDVTAGEAIEPSLVWDNNGTVVEGEVEIALANNQQVMLRVLSESATHFCIADSSVAGQGTVRGEGVPAAATWAACNALADW